MPGPVAAVEAALARIRQVFSGAEATRPDRSVLPVSSQMSPFEATAYARMLDEVLARHLRGARDRGLVRLPKVASYATLGAVLHEWVFTADAVLLRDTGPAVRLVSVAHLHENEPWPPRGVLAAADATWVLEEDGRVTRLY